MTPYPGTCRALEPVLWTPAGNSSGAPTDTSIRIVFDDYPDPDTFGSETLLLTTGFFWVPGAYRVDLIDRAVTCDRGASCPACSATPSTCRRACSR